MLQFGNLAVFGTVNKNSVGITTCRGSIPGKGKRFCLLHSSKPTLGPTQCPVQWVPGALSPGVNWPWREADHSPPSSDEVKNSGTILPLAAMCSRCGA
jgi:hypothetical protein